MRGTVGSLVAKDLRKLVELAKFRGYDIDLWMGSGWIEKRFELKGDPKAIAIVWKAFMSLDN